MQFRRKKKSTCPHLAPGVTHQHVSCCCTIQHMLTIASRLDALNRIGRALADPTRARILLSLLDAPSYPAELAQSLNLTRSNVSRTIWPALATAALSWPRWAQGPLRHRRSSPARRLHFAGRGDTGRERRRTLSRSACSDSACQEVR